MTANVKCTVEQGRLLRKPRCRAAPTWYIQVGGKIVVTCCCTISPGGGEMMVPCCCT